MKYTPGYVIYLKNFLMFYYTDETTGNETY